MHRLCRIARSLRSRPSRRHSTIAARLRGGVRPRTGRGAVGPALLVAPLLVTAGCAPQSPSASGGGVDLFSASVPQAASDPCPVDGTVGTEFTDQSAQLRVTVSGDDFDTLEATGDVGSITVDEVPVGTDRFVAAYGLSANGGVLWRGVRSGVTVTEGTDTPVDVLMALVADVSCPRSGQAEPRAFHTATRLNDGRILLVGGASTVGSLAACEGCSRLEPTSFAEIYDPTSGVFSAVTGPLNVGRMLHTATLLDDGRVLIAGGTAEARVLAVDGQNPFPIFATAPIGVVEVFDPSTGMFSVIYDDPTPRVFHSATLTASGEVLISGGIDGMPANGINDLNNAVNTTTICGGSPLSCREGPVMQRARAGHLSFLLDTGDVILWGGSIDTGDVGGVPGYQTERLAPNATTFTMLSTRGMDRQRNLFFASGAQYLPFRVLAVGGLLRGSDGTFSFSTVDAQAGAEATVYVFDAAEEPGVSKGGSGAPAMRLSSPRFLATAAPLPDQKRAVIAGGFTTLTLNPADGLDLFDEGSLSVAPLSVGGTLRALRTPRGGLAAAAVGDGTVLFSGGVTGLGAERAPVQSGEIFADPQDPSPAR